jgi:hypothetical protein
MARDQDAAVLRGLRIRVRTPEFVARHILREAKSYLENTAAVLQALLDYADDGSLFVACPGTLAGHS